MTLNFQSWFKESQEYDRLLADYQANEEKYLQHPDIQQELNTTGRVTIRTIMKMGIPEGEANFISREINKRHGNYNTQAAYEKAQQPPTTDEYYYHITLKKNLPSIHKHGLIPGATPTFSNYANHSDNKIFICELGAINYWKERVAAHAFHNTGRSLKLSVLKIPKQAVPQVFPDKLGTEDSRQPAYYTQEPIPPQHIKVVE